MATFDAGVHVEAFVNMEKGLKTVYAVPATPEWSIMSSGDRIEFGSIGSITVGSVRRYSSLEDLCQAESWQNLVPEASDEGEAITLIRGIAEWDATAESKRGVIAVRVRQVKRKI